MSANKRIVFYISGKITGLPLNVAEDKFFKAQQEIRDKYPGLGSLTQWLYI